MDIEYHARETRGQSMGRMAFTFQRPHQRSWSASQQLLIMSHWGIMKTSETLIVKRDPDLETLLLEQRLLPTRSLHVLNYCSCV